MTIFDYAKKRITQCDEIPADIRDAETEVFIFCRTGEVPALRDAFGYDESTVLECTNLDESVRFASFDGYDFVSLVHLELNHDDVALREINLYISPKRFVLVVPEHESPHFAKLEEAIIDAVGINGSRLDNTVRLYGLTFQTLLADYSDMLEQLEDKIEELGENITLQVDKIQLTDINSMKKMTYTAKKQLRALSYIGSQILNDENRLLDKRNRHVFHGIDTRTRKLYDFAESLYNLSNELHFTYDSKISIRTNDTINKLTILTLFFGPLTVITGIYGMNFSFMPELNLPFGYPLILLAMILISLVMYLVLKHKKWL